MTHGHELRWGNDGGRRDKVEGNNGGEEWDNYNSIINKIYLKNKQSQKTTHRVKENIYKLDIYKEFMS